MNYSEYKNDKKDHRTYWLKSEITPETVRTTHKDYSLDEFFSDLNEVLEFLTINSKGKINFAWDIKVKKSLCYILVNFGPTHKSIKEISKELEIPEKNIKDMTRIFWYEVDLLTAIFEREIEKIKKLSPEDQMPALVQLCGYLDDLSRRLY